MRPKFISRRSLRNFVILLVAISVLQYLQQGKVSWPGNAMDWVTTTITDYAQRPEAAWRKASAKLEQLGAAKEGRPTPAFDLTGRVVRVADGDTLSVLDANNKQHKVRLYAIDTPEWQQSHGKTAKRALTQWVDGKTVGIVVMDTDSYGRTVGTVYRGDTNVNLAMVAAGHAWWYRSIAPHERALADAEQRARAGKLGLWSQSQPVPPWVWRRTRY
jgi:endonuclease YncB( thermonuclease family)